MRAYSQISPLWWTGNTGRAIAKLALIEADEAYRHALEVRIVGSWFMTGPMANQYGLYYAPKVLLQAETGVHHSSLPAVMERLAELDFSLYDWASEWVWVKGMAQWQMNLPLKDGDKRRLAAQRWYQSCPPNPFLVEFRERYGSLLGLLPRDVTKPLRWGFQQAQASSHTDAPSMGHKRGIDGAFMPPCSCSSCTGESEGGGKPAHHWSNEARAVAFERLYAAYPNKDRKQMALQVFTDAIAAEAEAERILAFVERKKAAGWVRLERRFIPTLAKFLEERRWEDAEPQGEEVPWSGLGGAWNCRQCGEIHEGDAAQLKVKACLKGVTA